MQLCFLGASDDTEPPALFPPNIQQVRHTRSDFLMLKENKQDSNFPFRKTNGLCYSSMVLFGQLETGNSELAFKEEKKKHNPGMDFAILLLHCNPHQKGRAMNGKSFTIIYSNSSLSSLASLCLATWHFHKRRFWGTLGSYLCPYHEVALLCFLSSA